MNNVFRPSHAFPAVPESTSVLHDLVTDGIAKEIEKLCADSWARFSAKAGTLPEQTEAQRKAYREKVDRLYPPRNRVIQEFEIIATRTGE
jgi:hypothetical protein